MERLVENSALLVDRRIVSPPSTDVTSDFSSGGTPNSMRQHTSGDEMLSGHSQGALQPSSYTKTQDRETGPTCKKPPDLLNSSAAQNVLVAIGHGQAQDSADLSSSSATSEQNPLSEHLQRQTSRYADLSKKLYALYPSQDTINLLLQENARCIHECHVRSGLASPDDATSVSQPSIRYVLEIPPPGSHPALLAKNLLIICFCLQQLPFNFDMRKLHSRRKAMDIASDALRLITSSVTNNDDLMGCLEGLEGLIVLGEVYADNGLIRRAWMSVRRATTMAQVMGINRKNAPPVRTCDPNRDASQRPTPSQLWSRINICDRYNSMILGLPAGSQDPSLTLLEPVDLKTPHDRLRARYTSIFGRMSSRNEMDDHGAYALTQTIDAELEAVANMIGSVRASTPLMSSNQPIVKQFWPEISEFELEIRHYTCIILLHLPYLLRDRTERRYEYNRASCMKASRIVVDRFLQFRNPLISGTSGRCVDYTALIGSMTLLMGHVGRTCRTREERTARQQDRELAEKAKATMGRMASRYNDKLAAESVELLSRLLPIEEKDAEAEREAQVNLTRPPAATGSVQEALCQIASQLPQYEGLENFDHPINMPTNDPGLWEWPVSAVGLDDWTLQGVDTTYWSMLNHGMS